MTSGTVVPHGTFVHRNLQYRGGHSRGRSSPPPSAAAVERHARVSRRATLIVEDVLASAGITDFSAYAAVPGTPDDELLPDFFLD